MRRYRKKRSVFSLVSTWLQESLRIANIAELSLRPCQYRRAFIALLPTENNNIPGLKCSLRHYKQITNLVCSEEKALKRAVCAIGNLFPNSQQLYEVRLYSFQGLSQEGGWADFSKNLNDSFFK